MIRRVLRRLFNRHTKAYPRNYRIPDITHLSKEEWEQIINTPRPDFTEMDKFCDEFEEIVRCEYEEEDKRREESKKQESKE